MSKDNGKSRPEDDAPAVEAPHADDFEDHNQETLDSIRRMWPHASVEVLGPGHYLVGDDEDE